MATPLEIPNELFGTSPAPVPMPTPPIRIGSLSLDPDSLELTDGERVDVLRPLPASLLFYLMRHRHRIVPKEELHRVLWPDTSVSDAALASAVRDLRRILDDDGEAQEIVRTFRGRGYRLVAPVEMASDGRVEAPDAEPVDESRPCGPVFVGRERELARFEQARTALEGGRGGTLLVEAVAGGGRTSFAEQCARRAGGVLWLGLRCNDEPWVPRHDAVARILRALETAVGAERFQDWVRHDPDVSHLLPDAASRPAEAAPRVEALAAALGRLLDRASRVAPVVIAIDDIHWIDPASLELLCTGFARSTLVLATADPARMSGRLRSGIDALFSKRSRIRLAGLASADIAQLASRLPHPRRDADWPSRIRERTGGHPADVLAVVEALAQGRPATEQATPLLPSAVFERLSRQIDAVSGSARALVIALAALPPGATVDQIRALADLPPERDADADSIGECVRAGLLRCRAESTQLEPAGQFVRHVALARITPERRRALESRALEVLRRVI